MQDAAAQEALVESIRAIIMPSDRSVSREQILSLLHRAGNDPNKAVDLFFQTHVNGTTTAVVADPTKSIGASPDSKSAPAATTTTSTTPAKAAATTPLHAAVVVAPTAEEWTPLANELSELLGGDVAKDSILALLRRTNNNLPKAVEIYFAENGHVNEDGEDDEDDDECEHEDTKKQIQAPEQVVQVTEIHNELFPAAEPPEIQPVTQHALVPLVPPPAPTLVVTSDAALGSSTLTPPSSAELESLLAPGTYEVIMVDGNFRWQIGNVFGRAVVQWVDPLGPAARAGIHKSDVLLSFRDTVVSEHNCSHIVQELSKERIIVPSSMRLRRAPDAHPPSPSSSSSSSLVGTTTASSPPKSYSLLQSPGASNSPTQTVVEVTRGSVHTNDVASVQDDGDVEMAQADDAIDTAESRGSVDPKYGLQILCQAVESMIDATGGDQMEKKMLVDLLLLAEFNLDLAVNNLLNEHRIVSDFRQVIGQDFDPANPGRCLKSEPYMASIPAGPLGLTVENILERTIVVDIKAGGAAERAAVKRSSWLVSLNGKPITHLTHKESLRMIETATRPLELELILIPQEDYRLLRKQLSMNIRQQKTERAIPEHDRMSFRVFQLKIHQAVLVMPRLVATCLFQHLTSEQLAPLSGPDAFDPLEASLGSLDDTDAQLLAEAAAKDEEASGDMCEERKFLLNLFASIHEYDDKGEGIVIRTIQFLGWLAKRYAQLQKHIDATPHETASSVQASRYTLLLSVVAHVLESLSIIENHATWDIMVDAFRLLISAMTDTDVNVMVVPMISRLSISPSPTARIVPVALLSLVFPRVKGDLRVQLRGMLDRMCNDDNPLVRRAIASIIGDLVNAGGASTASWGVQLLEKATADSHDIVRIFAVKGCIRLAQDLRRILYACHDATSESVDERLRLLFCQMVPMINTYTSDSSWQVRLEAAKTLPSFCLAFGGEYTDVFVDHFVGMVRDPTVEIRRTCAECVFEIGSALLQLAAQKSSPTRNSSSSADGNAVDEPPSKSDGPVEVVAAELQSIEIETDGDKVTTVDKDEHVVAAQNKIVRSLLPATYGLATDLSVAVRLALAKAVGKSLQLLTVGSYDDLVPIFTQILDDSQDANVRASLLEEMARHCDHSSETVSSMLVPAIKALRASGPWRVRVKYVHCVGAWAEQCDRSAVPLEFADSILELLGDTVSDVRSAACATLPTLARSVGREWLVTKAVPRISLCLQSTFNGRLTGLLAIEAVAPELKKADKLRDVIESVVEECTSKTANLRFRALRSLGFLVPLLDDRTTTQSTIEFVRPLTQHQTESDPDVRDTATLTLLTLEAALEHQQLTTAEAMVVVAE